MRFRSGLLAFLLCLHLAPAALAQPKPLLQFKGEFVFADPPEKIIAHRALANGKLVLIGKSWVRILDTANGSLSESRTLEIPDYSEDCGRVISPDGRWLLVSGNYLSDARKDKLKRPASIWDLQTGKQVAVLNQTTQPICDAHWSENGKTLATPNYGGAPHNVSGSAVEVLFWDGDTFKFHSSLPSDKINWWYLSNDGAKCFYSTGPVKSLLFMKYISDTGGPINVLAVASGTIENTISSSDGKVERKIRGIAISPDEKFLIFEARRPESKDTERRLVVWEIGKGSNLNYQLAEKYEIHPSPKIQNSPKFSPDGKYFVLVVGKNLQVYESQTGVKRFELPGIKSAPDHWLNDNKILLFDYETRLEARETATGKLLYQLKMVHIDYQYTDGDTLQWGVADSTVVGVHPNRDLLLTYSRQYVKVFNSLTGELLQTLVSPPLDYTKKKPRPSDEMLVSKAAWSPDGETLYVFSPGQKSVSLWQMVEN